MKNKTNINGNAGRLLAPVPLLGRPAIKLDVESNAVSLPGRILLRKTTETPRSSRTRRELLTPNTGTERRDGPPLTTYNNQNVNGPSRSLK